MLYLMMQQQKVNCMSYHFLSNSHNANLFRTLKGSARELVSHFQKSGPSDTGDRLAGATRHEIALLCKIKHISSLLLLPFFKAHLQHIESASWLPVSICYPPPSSPSPLIQHNLSHQKYCRIQLKSWDTEKVMFESTPHRIYAEISMWKRPNSGIVLHTPPGDEALSGNKRYTLCIQCANSLFIKR